MKNIEETQTPDSSHTMESSRSRRLQLKVRGMSCSFCTRTIEKVYRQTDRVLAAHVSLAHEEPLVEYDPERSDAAIPRAILPKLGYSARDLDRVKARKQQHEDLRLERG